MKRTSQESTTFQISSLGEIFDIKMSLVDKETPIYEVLETSRPEDLESTKINFEELQQQINKPILTEYNESVECLGESIKKEFEEKKRRTTKGYEEEFQALIIKKLKEDLKKHDKRESALTLLTEKFVEISCLKSLINNTEKYFVPRKEQYSQHR